MSAYNVVTLVGIVVIGLALAAIVAVCRTGSPIRSDQPGSDPACTGCGHGRRHHLDGYGCTETVHDGADRYDGVGNRVGTWGEHPCRCGSFKE